MNKEIGNKIIQQKTKVGNIKFFCPQEKAEWRATTLLTKEPETISWINSFNKKDILWDIGANIGMYSLYAGIKGINTLSFEPSPSNYWVLCKNIEINKLDEKISAYCIAFNNKTKLDTFYMAKTGIAEALNSFGEIKGWDGKPFNVSLK